MITAITLAELDLALDRSTITHDASPIDWPEPYSWLLFRVGRLRAPPPPLPRRSILMRPVDY